MKKLLAVLALAACAGSASAADVVGNPKAAPNKIEMCIGCHGIPGYKASFPEVYQVPMIGGQSAKYIESALHAYKKGDRKHPSMRGIAASLSDQDIADVAAYYSQQNAQTRK
ncbi:c-type cytochrome [Massilia litorea]|jgi:cytochrome c553|uniref:Cytochrome c n=1 Tax=Massilia litorea TaxID=2769491 RepID=A0A7L9UA85_9BURK|nr:cytochrome c [Massilia litorea]QOL51349.1 cytochrome c [Massilia litorea]